MAINFGQFLPTEETTDRIATAVENMENAFDSLPKDETVERQAVALENIAQYMGNLVTEIWDANTTYPSGAWCVWKGYLWHNTSGADSTGDEPGTNYNVWNVTYSNENLLDNPWFTVNQRGKSDYNTVGGYTFDRWKLWGQSVSKSGDVVTVTSQSDKIDGLFQTLESAPSGPLTISAILSDGRIISASDSGGTNAFGTIVRFVRNSATCGIWPSAKGASIGVKAVKLERGMVSTLANDTTPNYQAELAKCQRYFYRLGGGFNYSAIGAGCGREAGTAEIFVAFPVKMRTTPTMTPSSTFMVLPDYHAVTLAVDVIHTDTISIYATSSSIVKGFGYVLIGNTTTSYIDFSPAL